MKKTALIIGILILVTSMVGCKSEYKPPKEDIVKITEISSQLKGNTYSYFYVVDSSLIENIQAIGYTTATTIYESLKNEIGIKTFYLNIEFEIDKSVKLILNYQINKNINNLGLSLLKETLK